VLLHLLVVLRLVLVLILFLHLLLMLQLAQVLHQLVPVVILHHLPVLLHQLVVPRLVLVAILLLVLVAHLILLVALQHRLVVLLILEVLTPHLQVQTSSNNKNQAPMQKGHLTEVAFYISSLFMYPAIFIL
jgi:hypothetical protein